MGVLGVVIGFVNSYYIYMIGCVFIGVVVGGFWLMLVVIVMWLVFKESVFRVLVIFNSGNVFVIVIVVFFGVYFGILIGWCGVFLCLILVFFIVLFW